MAAPSGSSRTPAAEQSRQQQQQPPPEPRGQRQDKVALEKSNLDSLRKMFERMSKQLEAALPRFITAERMIRVATTTVQRVPQLLQCDPVTVVGAIMQSAQLGLEPDNITGAAYLVPFWNSKANRLECTLIPGYRGLMMLARRSKDITAFDARVVKGGDAFDFEYGSRQFLRHRPSQGMKKNDAGVWILDGPAGSDETIAAYMIAFYGSVPRPNAGERDRVPLSQFSVIFRPDLEKIKQFTKSRVRFGDNKGEITGPWIEHPDAMFTKSVIRRGVKLLPFSIELLTAVSLEERAIDGKSQNLGALVSDDLGVSFSSTDDEGDDESVDPDLVKKLDAGFAALEYTEARKTIKMQEFRGRLDNLAEWLEAEVAQKRTSSSTTKPAEDSTNKPATVTESTPVQQQQSSAAAPAAKDTKRGGRWKL